MNLIVKIWILLSLIFMMYDVKGQFVSNEQDKRCVVKDSLNKYLELFIKKYDKYSVEDFPIIIIDYDTAKMNGKFFLNVKFSPLSEFADLIASNDTDLFLSGGAIFDRKIVIRINVKMNMFMNQLNYYLNVIKDEDENYFNQLVRMVNKRVDDLNGGYCLGMQTTRYSPEMNLIFNDQNILEEIIFYDEENNRILKQLKKLGIDYELP